MTKHDPHKVAEERLITMNSRLESLHCQGQSSEEIIELADDAWSLIMESSPNKYSGAICQWIKLAYFRLPKKMWAKGDLWKNRELAQHTLAGYKRGIANVLMGNAFDHIDVYGDLDSALGILDVMRLIVENTEEDDLYPNVLMNRLYHEKRAFCMWFVKCYSDSVEEYEKALPFAVEESNRDKSKRAVLKVSGGWTLASYFSDLDGEGREEAQAKADWIISESANDPELSGIFDDTTHNLNLMKSGCRDRDEFKPYDII